MFLRLPNELWAIDCLKSDPAHFSFVLLDVDHFLDGVSQIEFLDDFSEFASVDLGEIKQIFHKKVHHAGRGILNLAT